MIIKRLEMCNFRQYIGHQTIEFSADKEKNVTVLIGINTSGKTTIIRAFEWCLYGKNGFDDTVLLNSEVRQSMNIGDVQDSWVAVTFIHNNQEYTMKRLYRYTCSDKRISNDVEQTVLKKPEEKVSLLCLKSDGQTKNEINQQNITSSIDRVLPKDLSDYFFFGGERISDIANRTDLSKAVRGLMGLTILENARDHLRRVLKSFNDDIDTSGDVKAQQAQDALETSKNTMKILLENKKNAKAQKEYYQKRINDLNVELSHSNVSEVRKAKAELDNVLRLIAANEEKSQETVKDIVETFNTRPFVFFGMPLIKKTLELLENVKETTESVPGMDQDAIDFLINRCTCICGTQLTPGSLPYQKVMQERKKLPPESIGNVVMNYKNKAEGYLAGSATFFENIDREFKKYRRIKKDIGLNHDEETEISKRICDDSQAKEIEQKLRDARNAYQEAEADCEQTVSEIGKCDGDIKNYERIISAYAKNSEKNKKISLRIDYTQNIYDWINDEYQKKENIVRSDLEKRVNDNFSEMYHGKRSIVIDDKYRVKYKDITTEESPGLRAVKSFAFIASLVSMAKDKIIDDDKMKLGQEYPIVMDAPFSNVDEIHIANICKILPHTANQVIMAVMKKDWIYAAENLNRYVGKTYIITKDKDINGKEIDTATHIVEAEV